MLREDDDNDAGANRMHNTACVRTLTCTLTTLVELCVCRASSGGTSSSILCDESCVYALEKKARVLRIN